MFVSVFLRVDQLYISLTHQYPTDLLSNKTMTSLMWNLKNVSLK